MAAFQFAAFGLIAPMLVFCEDGDRHRAIESAISLCCTQGTVETSDAIQTQASAGAAANGCVGSCTDTPLLTSIDATSRRSVAPASVAVALAAPVALAPCPAPVFSSEGAVFVFALWSPHLNRSTVLRI